MAEDYIAKKGDCISSIAFDHGFFWRTLWNHPNNAGLKQKRKDPNILKEGDSVHIPDLTQKYEDRPTDQKHAFVRKSVPAKLCLRFMKEKKKDQPDEGTPAGQAQADDESSYEDPVFEVNPPEMEPRADAPYLLDIDGSLQRGQLDADGRIEISIPPNAREASLILNPGTGEEEVVPLALGAMDPVDEVSGVRRRLCNLGFACSPEGDEMTDDLEVALRAFQEKSGIQVTAVIDQATKERLKEQHGS